MKFQVALSHALTPVAMEYFSQWANLFVVDSADSNEIAKHLTGMDGVLLRVAKLDATAIQSADKLKVIGRTGVGVDGVDVAAAAALGIPTVVTPGANSRSVAEFAVAALLTAVKNIPECDSKVRDGQFAYRNKYVAREFFGKNLLIIGFGNIGRQVAGMCKALGMQVAVYDAYVPKAVIEQAGYLAASTPEEYLPWADYISLHAPLTPETEHMIGAKQFDEMKRDVILINTARSGLMDEDELARRLNDGKVGAAVLDALQHEPPHPDDPILHADHAILAPHVAAQTQEAKEAMATRCIDGMVAIMQGKRWDAVADKSAYDNARWRG